MLAVAVTGILLLLWEGADGAAASAQALAEQAQPGELPQAPADPGEAVAQATDTIRDLAFGFWAVLPKIVIAAALLLLAAGLVRLVRPLLRRAFGRWEQGEATAALAGVLVWLLALGAALSVLAGDVRVLVGSVGLFGLALSWALQTPIEGFSAWLMNSFKGYYRVGDRIAVGEVFGDVIDIDFLTTTVWEAGGPEKPVRGAQPTGALVTFPNAAILREDVVNFTRLFPYVWDEVTVSLANRSDLDYALAVFEKTAAAVLGASTDKVEEHYGSVLARAGVSLEAGIEPRAFATAQETWVDVTVRYLAPARERRRWASALTLELLAQTERPEHAGRIVQAMPLAEVHLAGTDGGSLEQVAN
jgi:small conductance mechanosensitive channel